MTVDGTSRVITGIGGGHYDFVRIRDVRVQSSRGLTESIFIAVSLDSTDPRIQALFVLEHFGVDLTPTGDIETILSKRCSGSGKGRHR